MGFEMQYRPGTAMLRTDDERQMGFWLHLSQLANVFPPFGIVVPIVMWQMKKDEIPALDAHGKMVVNWLISSAIYSIVSTILIAVFFIGLIPLVGLVIAGIVFPIIGAVKANNGELWDYPLTIKF